MPASSIGTVIGAGAWLKSRACALDGEGLRWSALHGDLATPQACEQLQQSLQALIEGARTPVAAIAHDLHPDFFSTRLAQSLAAERGAQAIAVQHHHAHVAAVVAEHALDRSVIGLALDGVGMGSDGTAWGGELLWVHHARWARLGHLSPLALPGGDRAAREPWRMASAALHALGRGDEIGARFGPFVGDALARGVQQMLARDLHCPRTTSAGRWFDAAAGALGLVLRQDEEAQAAVALEHAAAQGLEGAVLDHALLERMRGNAGIDMLPLLQRLLEPAATAADVQRLAALFHLHLAEALCDWAAGTARAHGVQDVCLGGGCFLNQILCARVAAGLEMRGLRAHLPRAHSCGDAGLALGQAWVAAHELMNRVIEPVPIAVPLEKMPCV